jgi:multiple sugar transport system substrate-binding protein
MAKRLVLVLVPAVLLIACAGGGTPPYEGEPTTITFACHDYELDTYKPLVEAFHEAYPDIHVQLVSADEASGMRREANTVTSDGKEIERLAANADTFVWFAGLRPTDYPYLLNLQPFVDGPYFPAEDYYAGTLDLFRWQDGLWGLPAQITPHLIYYDRDLLDQADVPYPHIGWTWDDLLDAATRLTEREGETIARYGFAERSQFLFAMVQQHGVSLWDDRSDPSQPRFDTPEVAYVIRRYLDMILTHKIMAGEEVLEHGEVFDLINGGQVAMWSGYANQHKYHAVRTNVGIAPFPEDVAAANPRSTSGFYISAGTAHPRAAWRWLTYLSDNYQPPSFSSGSLPARRSLAEQMRWWKALDEESKAVYEYVLAYPSRDDMRSRRLLWRAVNRVLEDEVSVEEALAGAQSEASKQQFELTAATPPPPRPVATPLPTPSEDQAVIAFAPFPSEDMSIYRALASTYSEHSPGIQVEIVSYSFPLAELSADADCFGGILPVDSPGTRQHVRSLEPLMEADAAFDLSDYYPQMLEAVLHEGQLWGLPYQADALMVYYNRDLLTEAGVAPPELDWSFDDFLETAVDLSADDRYGFTTCEGAYGDLVYVMERMGARLYDDAHDPPTPIFDDATVIAALGRYADLFRERPISPRTPSTKSGWPDAMVRGNHPDGVQSEQVAMWVDSLESHAFGRRLPFETGVAPLPRGTKASTEFDFRAYYISTHSEDPEACWEWLKFLSEQTETVRFLPTRRGIAQSAEWREQVDSPALPAYLATLEYGDTAVFDLRWEIRWLAYAYPWLDGAFVEAVRGGNSAQALSAAQDKAEALLACLDTAGSYTDTDQLHACARQVDPSHPVATPAPAP